MGLGTWGLGLPSSPHSQGPAPPSSSKTFPAASIRIGATPGCDSRGSRSGRPRRFAHAIDAFHDASSRRCGLVPEPQLQERVRGHVQAHGSPPARSSRKRARPAVPSTPAFRGRRRGGGSGRRPGASDCARTPSPAIAPACCRIGSAASPRGMRRQQRERIERLRVIVRRILGGDPRHLFRVRSARAAVSPGPNSASTARRKPCSRGVFAFAIRAAGVAPSFASAALPLSTSSKNHSGWLKLIASPQYAIAKLGSIFCAARNASIASSYMKLWSHATPRRNSASALAWDLGLGAWAFARTSSEHVTTSAITQHDSRFLSTTQGRPVKAALGIWQAEDLRPSPKSQAPSPF